MTNTPSTASPTKSFPWRYSIGGVVLLLAAFIAWLVWPLGPGARADSQDLPVMQEQAPPIQVQVARVARQDLPLLAEATGTLQPWRQVEVSAEVAGKVTWRGIEEGQWVEAGAVALRLDDANHRLELGEAEAELLKVQADFAVSFAREKGGESAEPQRSTGDSAAEIEYRQARRLFDQGLIAEADVERARRRFDSTQLLGGHRRQDVRAVNTGLTQAELRLERARLALDQTEMRAPFGGRIADLQVEVGQRMTVGNPCFLLLDDSRLSVEVAVLETDVIRLRPGAPAQVRVPALGEQIFDGRVHTINPRVDRETGTARVEVRIANPDGLLIPGLFAYVVLQTGHLEERLQVPTEAILERQNRQLVFRVADGRALWTYVETGIRSGNLIEIMDGLAEGDLVAVAHHFSLAHEAPVTLAPTNPEG